MRHKQTANLRYPGLWRGCVGAWAPCLGPSGSVLPDRSPRRNHGTLTKMDPATDWAVSRGRHVLDFDGTNDRVQTPLLFSPGTGAFAIEAWYHGRNTSQFSSIVTTRPSGFTVAGMTTGIFAGNFITGAAGKTVSFGIFNNSAYRSIVTNSDIDDGTLKHVLAVSTGSALSIYVNGFQQAVTLSTSGSWPDLSSLSNWCIGAGNDSALPLNGQVAEVRVYRGSEVANRVSLLAQYPGVAYATRRRRTIRKPVFRNRQYPQPIGVGIY